MNRNGDARAEDQIFRYWVELRDLRDGTVRELPVTFVKRIFLGTKRRRRSKNVEPAPADPAPELRVRVRDDGREWDAADRDDLARQLREAYPDGAFQRTLKCERDLEAEERHRSAIESLARIIAEATVEKWLAEETKKKGGA